MLKRILFSCIFCLLCSQVEANTLKVGPDSQYLTIQNALNAASDGDTIILAPGTYKESISLRKPVTLKGAGENPSDSIIEGGGNLLSVSGLRKGKIENVTFRSVTQGNSPLARISSTGSKFTIRNTIFDGTGTGTTAVVLDGSATVHFQNVQTRSFTDNGWKIENTSHVEASHCRFDDIGRASLSFSGNTTGAFSHSQFNHSYGGGINATDHAKVRVKNSSLGDLKFAFYIDQYAQLILDNVVVDGTRESSVVGGQGEVKAHRSTFARGKGGGLTVQGNANIHLQLVAFRDNRRFALTGSGTSKLYGNNVFLTGEDGIGVLLREGVALSMLNAKFDRLPHALVLQTESANKHIITNTLFSNCGTGVTLDGKSIAEISGSEFIACETGIKISDSASAKLTEATILGSHKYAVEMHGNSQLIVRRSVFKGGKTGLYVDGRSNFNSMGSSWSDFSEMLGQLNGNAVINFVNDGFTDLSQGLVISGNTKAHLSKCEFSDIADSWLQLNNFVHLKITKTSITRAGSGIHLADNASLKSIENTYTEISGSALSVTGQATVKSTKDRFKKGLHAITSVQTTRDATLNLIEAVFAEHTGSVLVVAGQGKVSIIKSGFNKEKRIVDLQEEGVVEISESDLNGIAPGGVTLAGQSSMTLSRISFSSVEHSPFIIQENSHLLFSNVTFSKAKGALVDGHGEATLEFTKCRLSDISGPLVESGEDRITIIVDESELVDFKTPIEIAGHNFLKLTNVIMRGVKEGIKLTEQGSLQILGLNFVGAEKQAIYLDSSGEISIQDAIIKSNDSGILCSGKSSSKFINLEVTAPNIGLVLGDASVTDVTNLKIAGSKTGVTLSNSAVLAVHGGTMKGVVKVLTAEGRSRSTVSDFTVEQSKEGVLLTNESGLVLSNSLINSLGKGVHINENASFEGAGTTIRAREVGLSLHDHAKINLNNLSILLPTSKGDGIRANGLPQGQIDGFNVDGGTRAMVIKKSLPLVFKNIHFSNNKETGLLFVDTGSANIFGGTIEGNSQGMVFKGESRPIISDVTCINCKTGFVISDNSQPSLINCGVKGGANGVLAEKTSKSNLTAFQAVEGAGQGYGIKYTDSAMGTLKEPLIGGGYTHGIILRGKASPFIFGTTEKGHVKNCVNGITISGTGSPIIYSMLIEDNSKYGIMIEGSTKSEEPTGAYISGCRIRSHMGGAGIYVGENGKAHILGLARDGIDLPNITNYYQNIIRSNLYGIKLARNGEALIDGNMIENNGVGIMLAEKSSASIHRNHIRESKFIVMDQGGIGIVVADHAKMVMTDHNRIYKNRAAGIKLMTSADGIIVENNEIYENVNLPPGSKLKAEAMGAVMIKGSLTLVLKSNYIHNNFSSGIVVFSGKKIDVTNNLFERNKRSALHLERCRNFVVKNNTFIGTKNNDVGILLGSGVSNYDSIRKFSLHNNIFSKFSIALNASSRLTRIDNDWIIRRNSIHNCEFENGPNLPDLLKNYKLDPIFSDPNGKGRVAFTPEPGSNVCNNSKIYDWGGSRYCGAFQCRKVDAPDEQVKLAIVTPQKDGDIVPRKLAFKANVVIPEGKEVGSWELYVNENLITQSRGASFIRSENTFDPAVQIETLISSLPYGKSQIRLEVNSSTGEQWTADRTVYTAACSETHKRWVVLVGISDYNDYGGVPDLTYAASDAMALGKILNRRSPFSPFQDVEVITLTDSQATREGLREVLFGKIAPCVRAEDEVIIFFAGHGAVQKDRFYLVLHDSELNRLELTGYEMQELRDVIRYNIKSDNIMLLFDTCHSGGVTQNRIPANVLNNQLYELTTTMENINIITASQGAEQSYEFSDCCLKQVNGQCADDTPLSNEGHGAFTCTLLHAMMGYEMEDEKSRMSFVDISQFISEWLPKITDQQQHPQILSNSYKTLDVTTIPIH